MKRLSLVVTCLLGSSMLYGQAESSSGDIQGFVLDANAVSVPGVKLTATEQDRGSTRTADSDSNGEYRLTPLPPGTYRIRAEAKGFTIKVIEHVQVRVGDTVGLEIRLETGPVATQMLVSAEPPVIEAERTQQSTTIDGLRLQNLPINRRNYLDFALLAPGVVGTNSIADGTDYRIPQSPQSGLSFGGGNGRGNMFLIDGVENYINSGGVRPGVSQEAVQEFQINRNSYGAEFGGGHGGVINIVTKSGTNNWHSSLFGYFRSAALQARNYFDPTKSDYFRAQDGASVNGPLKRDKTFLFVGFDRLDRNETAFVPLLWDSSVFSRLTAPQGQLLDYLDKVPQFASLSHTLRAALNTTNFPATIKLFQDNSGQFPFSGANSQLTARLDHQFSARNSSFLRTSFSRDQEANAHLGAQIGYTRGHSVNTKDMSIVANHIFLPAPGWVTETRAQFAYYHLGVVPNDPNGPELNITGFGYFGRDAYQPSAAWERHYQIEENVGFSSGSHHVRFGVDVDPVRDRVFSSTFFGGRFAFGQVVPLSAAINWFAGPNFSAGLANTLVASGQAALVPALSSGMTALQSFNLGLPTFYQQGFGNPVLTTWQPRVNTYVQDTFDPIRGLTLNIGLRYEFEGNPKPVNTNMTNFAPRFGLAWTPSADRKTVLRAGFGIFYSHIDSQVNNLAITLNGSRISQAFTTLTGSPAVFNAKTGSWLTSADIFQTFLAQGFLWQRPITPADLAQFGWVPGPNQPGRVLFGIVPDFRNPYSEQGSLEVEHAFGSIAVSASYIFNRGIHLVRTLDRNLYYSGRLASGQPTFGFKDPSILQNNVLESSANSFYNALVVQVSQRFTRHVAFNAHYTYSKAIDEVVDFNSDFEPQDQLNARAERALSLWDMRHRFVLNAVIESPLRSAAHADWMHRIFANFVFSPIVSANSSRPFNVLAGYDNLGDNHPDDHRPLGLGRNAGRGPGFFTVDARLSRRFPFGRDGRRNLEAIAEGFNLLNHTNFASVNNTVGGVSIQDLPQPIMGIRGNPILPLSYTSAFDPRQLQLGLRLNF